MLGNLTFDAVVLGYLTYLSVHDAGGAASGWLEAI
jgi:hypothetical protein